MHNKKLESAGRFALVAVLVGLIITAARPQVPKQEQGQQVQSPHLEENKAAAVLKKGTEGLQQNHAP